MFPDGTVGTVASEGGHSVGRKLAMCAVLNIRGIIK